MGLQWMLLTCVVAAETVVAIILTLPSPKALKYRLVSLISLILQPAMFVLPFAAFQLLDLYWKWEHQWPKCTGETCTSSERDRLEKGYFKFQRNTILCGAACFLYWSIFRICKYYKDIQRLELVEKRAKDM